jgi:hypothetical protein
MLTPRLTNSLYYGSIPVLLQDINNRLAQLADYEYNNIVYSLNYYISGEVVQDLLNYQRILEYKQCNPDYCANFTVEMIGSRVIILINK